MSKVLSANKASALGDLMHTAIHQEIADLEAAKKGSVYVTNNEDEVLLDVILSRYQQRSRTGHQTLSSDMEENEERDGK